MPEPKSPVIVGLEKYEVTYGGPQAGQPQYLPLPALVSRDASRKVMSRWELTDAEREWIANGADVFIVIHTFGTPYPPTEVHVLNKNAEHLPAHIGETYGLKDQPVTRADRDDVPQQNGRRFG